MRLRPILIVVVCVVILAAGIYFFFHSSATPAPLVDINGQSGSLPGAQTDGVGAGTSGTTSSSSVVSNGGSVALVDDGSVFSYFVNTSGTVTLVRPDGTVWSSVNGKSSLLSSTSISDLISVNFSFDGKKVAIQHGGLSNAQTSVFDLVNRSWTELSMGALSFAWSPIDYRLAYLRSAGEGSESLNIVDLSKVKPTPTTPITLYVQDMIVQWAVPGTIIMAARPSAYANNSVLAFNIAKSAVSPVVVSRPGFWASWNPISQMGIAFTTTPAQRGGYLQLVDAAGVTIQDLSFLTFPSKCVFGYGAAASSSATVATSSLRGSTSTRSSFIASLSPVFYCGVPYDQDALSYYPLPDAYLQHAVLVNDALYRVNIATGHVDTVLSGFNSGLDATLLRFSGNKLYFVNWYDKKLYSTIVL